MREGRKSRKPKEVRREREREWKKDNERGK